MILSSKKNNSLKHFLAKLIVLPPVLGASLLFGQETYSRYDFRHTMIEKESDLNPSSNFMRGLKPFRLSLSENEPQSELAFAQEIQQELKRLAPPSFSFFAHRIGLTASVNSGYTWLKSPSLPVLEVKAITNPLLSQSAVGGEGRFLEQGRNGFIETPLTLQFDSWLDLHITPLLTASSQKVEFQKNEDLRLQRLYAQLNFRKLSLQVGRDTVSWGVGRLGHLLFSGQQRPIDMIRLRNNAPIELPWFLKLMGPSKFEAFLSRLDDQQTIKNPYIVGTKASFRPSSQLEVGLGYLVEFGGKGAPTQNPAVYFGEVFSDTSGSTNRLFAFDVRYRFKNIPIEPYAEIMFEDCCDGVIVNPRDTLNLFGLHLSNIDGQGKLDLTLEWARTSYITYRHGTFRSGMSYRNQLLGHSIGPDATSMSVGSRYWLNPFIYFNETFSYEVRGRSGSALSRDGTSTISFLYPNYQVPEQRFRFVSNVQWAIPGEVNDVVRSTVINFEAGLEAVTSNNFQQFKNRTNAMIGLSVQTLF